jgi:outer membrane beta-barrel protein
MESGMIHLGKLSRMLLVIAILGVTSALCRTARAADDADEVATYAVQRRIFPLGLEVNAGLGILPLNAFHKGMLVDGTVTYHFSSVWSWEIIQGAYAFAQTDTGLQQQLVNNFGVQPTQLTSANFLASTNLVFTPFYGKLAGLNHSVSHIEIFFPIGAALARYENPSGFQEGIDLGLGLRWFLSTHWSLRFDARDFLLTPGISNFSLTNELYFTLGLSVAFGGPER